MIFSAVVLEKKRGVEETKYRVWMEQNIYVVYKGYNAFTSNELWLYMGRFELAFLKEKRHKFATFCFLCTSI